MNTISGTNLFDRLGQPDRIRQIASYDLLRPGLRARLDDLAARTAEHLHTPVSMISVVLDSAQFILGQHGVPDWLTEIQGIPAEWSLCVHTVLSGRPYCIDDGPADPAHADNPTLSDNGVRSYAGVPLIDDSGHVLGAHCVFDTTPRVFTDHEIVELTELAAETMHILAEHRTA